MFNNLYVKVVVNKLHLNEGLEDHPVGGEALGVAKLLTDAACVPEMYLGFRDQDV